MKNIVSPQAKSVYDVLLASGQLLTAEQIADQLNIMPNTIYRAAQQLVSMGMVAKSKTYPVTYRAVPPDQALPWYLLQAQKSFKATFGQMPQQRIKSNTAPSLIVVKDRDDFLRKTTQDIKKAQQEVAILVSGLEVPAETVAAYQKVIARGVRVRVLIQQPDETSEVMLTRWRDIGAEIKQVKYAGLRLFIIDNEVAYLVSYSKQQSELALGVRYNYPPLAKSMLDFFEQHWYKAKDVQ